MIMEKHYYLVNGTVKVSDSKMPVINEQWHTYNAELLKWSESIQPCEIDESELIKIRAEIADLLTDNPIDITDIVAKKVINGDDVMRVRTVLVFKQPTEKQVESDLWQEFLEWKRKQNNK